MHNPDGNSDCATSRIDHLQLALDYTIPAVIELAYYSTPSLPNGQVVPVTVCVWNPTLTQRLAHYQGHQVFGISRSCPASPRLDRDRYLIG